MGETKGHWLALGSIRGCTAEATILFEDWALNDASRFMPTELNQNADALPSRHQGACLA